MIEIAYATFGEKPPSDLRGLDRGLIWALCAAFVLISLLVTIVLNFFALFTGTLILFLGRDRLEFRFLRIFGRFPAIGLAFPALLGFAIWHEAQQRGAWIALLQMVAIWIIGAVAIAFCAGWRVLGSGRRDL